MSWICPTCDRAHAEQYDEPTQCEACGLREELEAELEFQRHRADVMEVRMHEAEAERDEARRHIDAAGDGLNLLAVLDLYHDRMVCAEAERDEARALGRQYRDEAWPNREGTEIQGLAVLPWEVGDGENA